MPKDPPKKRAARAKAVIAKKADPNVPRARKSTNKKPQLKLNPPKNKLNTRKVVEEEEEEKKDFKTLS